MSSISNRLELIKTTQSIKDTMTSKRVSYPELAERTNISQQHLRKIMKGEHGMSVQVLVRICEALELEIKLEPKVKEHGTATY
jgi:transcriptional regulator with XRE-family HTH domain